MIWLRKVISFNLNICKQIYSLTKEMNVQKLSISKRGRLCAKLVFKRPAESTEVLEAAQPANLMNSARRTF
jgi:hypothetical protein